MFTVATVTGGTKQFRRLADNSGEVPVKKTKLSPI